MLLDFKKVFSGDLETLSFDYEMNLSSVDINGYFPFISPVRVSGMVKGHEGFAQLDVAVSFDFSMPCDRCTKMVRQKYDYTFSHVVVLSLEKDDDEDYVEARDYKIDLDELMRADILLELPSKFLCREDCKGLCPYCGKNLNEGKCQCNTHQIDPRLEVLKKLID